MQDAASETEVTRRSQNNVSPTLQVRIQQDVTSLGGLDP
jgi:hypothetical protein